MSDPKVKFYRNPERNQPENYKPYIPQYQIMGVEPTEMPSSVIAGKLKISPGSPVNPRDPKPVFRQPYAEPNSTPVIGRGRSPMPNIGNNLEQTWSSVDGQIVDDISGQIESDQFSVGQLDPSPFMEDTKTTNPQNGALSQSTLQAAILENQLSEVISQLDEDEYCLLVNGEAVCSGNEQYIEEETRNLVFGENSSFDEPVPIEKILILKRVKIKVGIFLE